MHAWRLVKYYNFSISIFNSRLFHTYKIQDKFIRPVVNTYYYTALICIVKNWARETATKTSIVAVAAATRFIFKQVLVC